MPTRELLRGEARCWPPRPAPLSLGHGNGAGESWLLPPAAWVTAGVAEKSGPRPARGGRTAEAPEERAAPLRPGAAHPTGGAVPGCVTSAHPGNVVNVFFSRLSLKMCLVCCVCVCAGMSPPSRPPLCPEFGSACRSQLSASETPCGGVRRGPAWLSLGQGGGGGGVCVCVCAELLFGNLFCFRRKNDPLITVQSPALRESL